jgi:Domain of unknown function (DUF305)
MKAHYQSISTMSLVLIAVLLVCALAHRTTSNSTSHFLALASSDANRELVVIDSLIACHENAIALANRALKDSSMSDVKVMAEEIRRSRQVELQQLLAWRHSWYPAAAVVALPLPMHHIKISEDRNQPFDWSFLETMIPQNHLAMEVAEEGKLAAEHPEFQAFLTNLIDNQEDEVADMKQWQTNWYGNLGTLAAR